MVIIRRFAQSAPRVSSTTNNYDWSHLVTSANGCTMESEEWAQELFLKDAQRDVKALQAALEKQETMAKQHAANMNYESAELHISANSATAESEWAQEVLLKDASEKDVKALQAALEEAMAKQNTPAERLHVSPNSATMEAEGWAQELFLKDAQKDVQALQAAIENEEKIQYEKPVALHVSANSCTMESEWAHEILLKDAQQDVQALQAALEQHTDNSASAAEAQQLDQMLHQWTLSSPESAIGYTHVGETMNEATQQQFGQVLQQHGLDTTGPSIAPQQESPQAKAAIDLMMQHMLLASPESATGYVHVTETMTQDLKHNFAAALAKPTEPPQDIPLPKTFQDAIQDNHQRAIVVTTAVPPFRVVHVNAVWEGLCGYSQQEASGKPIGKLLQGLETQAEPTRKLVQQVLEQSNNTASMELINYTKTGRKFHNKLQLGALYNESSKVEYLIGVLQEVEKKNMAA